MNVKNYLIDFTQNNSYNKPKEYSHRLWGHVVVKDYVFHKNVPPIFVLMAVASTKAPPVLYFLEIIPTNEPPTFTIPQLTETEGAKSMVNAELFPLRFILIGISLRI
jgi:hypothetical protein